MRSYFDLFSDFTFYMNNPVQGDQFEQLDDRSILGGQATQSWVHTLLGADSRTTAGVQIRDDLINEIGLFNTENRTRFSTDSDDSVAQAKGALYVSNSTHWGDWFRTTIGLRGDLYYWDVNANIPGNSGVTTGSLFS